MSSSWSIIFSFLDTRGINEPWNRIEISTIVKTILKRICSSSGYIVETAGVAIIANTMDAAPLRPTNETNACWLSLLLKGDNIDRIETGRATNTINKAIKAAGSRTEWSSDGFTRR